MKLEKGMVIKTNYGERIYKIRSIRKGCTCTKYTDVINGKNTPSEIHNHLVVCDLDETRDPYYLNGYRDDGSSVWYDDKIIIVKSNQCQLSFF